MKTISDYNNLTSIINYNIILQEYQESTFEANSHPKGRH